MSLRSGLIRLTLVSSAVVSAIAVLPAAQIFAGVSLKGSNEVAPAGTMAQMKVFVTEPKPISTGHGRMEFDGFDAIGGVALVSPADDAFGVAVVRNGTIDLALRSPSGTFGTDSDYPILTVTGHVPATAAKGTVFPFDIDAASLRLVDPRGVVYPNEVAAGSLTVGPSLTVSNVVPGSAQLAAGSVVTITGTGFKSTTEVRFNETALKSVRVLSSTRIEVVLAQAARMHGKEIRVRNPGAPRVEYFSYQRTRRSGRSALAALQDAVPLFPSSGRTVSAIDLSGVSSGLGFQNISSGSITAVAELFNKKGVRKGTSTITIPSNRYAVFDVAEIFSLPYAAGWTVRVTTASPLQVMGIAVDAAGSVSPILPR